MCANYRLIKYFSGEACSCFCLDDVQCTYKVSSSPVAAMSFLSLYQEEHVLALNTRGRHKTKLRKNETSHFKTGLRFVVKQNIAVILIDVAKWFMTDFYSHSKKYLVMMMMCWRTSTVGRETSAARFQLLFIWSNDKVSAIVKCDITKGGNSPRYNMTAVIS